MPNPLNVPITPPRVAFIDPRSGTVSREWYMFFLSMSQSIGGSGASLDDVQKGPPAASIDEINALVVKLVDNLNPTSESLVSMLAEVMKYLDALSLAPVSEQPIIQLDVPPPSYSPLPAVNRVTEVTTNHTFEWDESMVYVTVDALTITLPQATMNGPDRTVLQDVVGSVTVAPGGSDTIILPVGTTISMYNKGDSLTFRPINNSTWGIV